MNGIAIVGQGRMGRTHARAWTELGHGGAIKYVCTPRPIGTLSWAPEARVLSDLTRVLADPDIEVVSVCSPTHTHREIAIAALAAGKHVLLEKPIALTLDDAVAIDAARRHNDGLLMVAHVVRFSEAYQRLRSDVTTGLLGEMRSARATRVSQMPDWADWWHDEERSGGVVVDFSIHDLDQMNVLLGVPRTVRVAAVGRLGPVEITVQYVSGAIGQVLGYADAGAGVPFSNSISAYGSSGEAHFSAIAGEDTSTYERRDSQGVTRTRLAADDPYLAQARYFAQCIADKVEPVLAPVDDALTALRVSLAARASIHSGGAVITVT